MMERRTFLVMTSGGPLLTAPLAAAQEYKAQQEGTVR